MPRPEVPNDPHHYLLPSELSEAHTAYRTLAARIRSTMRSEVRRYGSTPYTTGTRQAVTKSVRIATVSDADVDELHREWTTIARLAEQRASAPEELVARLRELAEQMRSARDAARIARNGATQ